MKKLILDGIMVEIHNNRVKIRFAGINSFYYKIEIILEIIEAFSRKEKAFFKKLKECLIHNKPCCALAGYYD